MALALTFGGIGDAFRSRNFKIFWWGQLNLGIGAWVFRLAVAWLVWELTHSTAWLGIAVAAQTLPMLILCPIGGVCADRYGHLRQLIWSLAATGASGFAIGIMAWLDMLSIEWIVALCFINGCSRAFSISSRQALVPALVEPKLLTAAISFNSATYYASNFVGPLVGGALINYFGVGWALAYFGIGAYIAVATLPLIMLERLPLRSGPATNFLQDLSEGLTYAARHSGIRLMILMIAVMALCVQPTLDMLASVAADVLMMGENGLAKLATTFGCGAMCGGLFLAWRGRAEGLTRILLGGVVLALLALMVFAVSTTIYLSIPALFVTGVCLVVTSTSASSLIQNSVEPRLRARVVALDGMISAGTPAFGGLLIGWVGAHVGIQIPLFAAATLGLIVVALTRHLVRRETRNLETVRLGQRQAAA